MTKPLPFHIRRLLMRLLTEMRLQLEDDGEIPAVRYSLDQPVTFETLPPDCIRATRRSDGRRYELTADDERYRRID